MAPEGEPMRAKTWMTWAMVLALAMPALAKDKGSKEQERLENAGEVLEEAINMPDGLPKDLLNKAECVVVIPSMKKFAIGIGGNYGRGVMVCRGGANYTGPWGPPAMYALEGANIGFQLGGTATDFFFLVMNPKGAKSLLKSKVKLGADAAAAAGPKGRDAQAATDVVMSAEILTYSRSKGLFAGISLDGSTLRSDGGANKNLYGRDLSATEIIREHKVSTPAAGRKLIGVLDRVSPRNLSDPKSLKVE
jgi:lipid-binding SYLF domain-containing protein